MSDIGDQIERGSDGPEWQHVPIWKCETKDDAIEQANALARIAAIQRDTGWTPEPWRLEPFEDSACHPQHRIVNASGYDVCDSETYYPTPPALPDMHRICACVNACAGMSDPAADLARLRAEHAAERERVRVLREALQECVCWVPTGDGTPEQRGAKMTWRTSMLAKVEAALAATEPTP